MDDSLVRAGWRVPRTDEVGSIVEPELHDGTMLGIRVLGEGDHSEARLYFRCARGVEYEFALRPGRRCSVSVWSSANLVHSIWLQSKSAVDVEHILGTRGSLELGDETSVREDLCRIESGEASLFRVKGLIDCELLAITRIVEYRVISTAAQDAR